MDIRDIYSRSMKLSASHLFLNDKKFSEFELPYQRRITEKRLNLLVIELHELEAENS